VNNLAIYIHYPFCKSKCPYCDFNSHVRDSVDTNIFTKAYLTELDYFYQHTGDKTISSIFFGGGTPSLMPTSMVATILEAINKKWGFADDIEITLEANPTSSEAGKLKAFKDAGINRLSIGVQSLQADQLKFLGREHSADQAIQTIKTASKVFDKYSFDLIYALPQQTITQWRTQLLEALPLVNNHISLYQLTIEPATQFYHHYNAGKFTMPSNEVAADFYEATQEICDKHNLPAYEISNHAKKGYECKHNLAYWGYQQYLGIGPGAHGRVDINGNLHATEMLKSPEKWLEQVNVKKHGLKHNIELTAQDQLEERLIMGMRQIDGVKLSQLSQNKLQNLFFLNNQNLIEVTNTHLKPTKHGLLLINQVIEHLLKN